MKDKILKLRQDGLSYSEIIKRLNCSRALVSYYCGNNQKEKTLNRQRKNRIKTHPYKLKINSFINPTSGSDGRPFVCSNFKLINFKIRNFSMINNQYQKPEFSVEDVINKFGEKPKCYLTGEEIDIYQPRTYHFDHIIPRSKGGNNSLENLGICTKNANHAKHDMYLEDFIALCKSILENHGYIIKKS